MSRRELAIKAGVDQSHLGRIERNEVDPRMSTVRRLARVLGLSVLQSGAEPVTTPVEDATASHPQSRSG